MPLRRYEPGQRFGKHYDETIDMGGGLRTAYTLLVYLSGHTTGMQGGETIFYSHGKQSCVLPQVAQPRKVPVQARVDCEVRTL